MNYLYPLGIALATLVIRIPFLAEAPAGWDDVDFALGLGEYDLARMQPHFPGYPVYMLLAMGVARFISNPFLALSTLSAIAAACTVFPLYMIVKRCWDEQMAGWVALAWAVNPLVFVLGTQPMSDSFGGFLAISLVATSLYSIKDKVEERKRATLLLASGILLGLLYGVRISYLPFGFVFLWAVIVYVRDTGKLVDGIYPIVACGLVNLLWLYGLILNVGSVSGLWALATAFTGGHFSDWGGTYVGGSLFERLAYWISRQWFAAGLGTPWNEQNGWESYLLLVLTVLGIVGFFVSLKSRIVRNRTNKDMLVLLCLWIVPYLLWAFFAQNVDKPRHMFPLLIPLLWGIIAGLLHWKRYISTVSQYLLIPLLVLGMCTVSVAQVHEQAVTHSPMVKLADYLAQHAKPDQSVVFTYEEERVIRYLYPSMNTIRLRKWSDLQISLLSNTVWPEQIYLTDRVLKGFNKPEVEGYVTEVARFRGSEWLYPTYNEIVLYEVRSDKKMLWKQLIQSGL